jgi:Fe-S-cluster containining protein
LSSEPWYAEGLRFQCQRCGACCSGEPGYVYFSHREAEAAAQHLGLSLSAFHRLYTRTEEGRISLREKSDGSCIFLREGECSIYRVRPVQCRTFPFWRWNVSRRERWEETASECPGIGKGRNFTPAEVAERLRRGTG